MQQLKKFLTVDVFGSGDCADPGLNCPRARDEECLQMLNTTYKVSNQTSDLNNCLCYLASLMFPFQFYLSLENSLCRDYVTEKFWKVLPYNVIPVVLNGADMPSLAPPHSYIDMNQFSSVHHLAEYMIKVSQDDKLFASYFWWRSFYKKENLNLKPVIHMTY